MALSDVFSYTAFVHAVAGTAGGSAAMTLFYPLDALRSILQVSGKGVGTMATITRMLREEGLEAFYSGLKAVLISLGVSNFVYFYANNLFKVLIKKATQKEITIVQNLFIASLAGVVNVLTTCPLWVANTRLRLQSGKGHGSHGATPKADEKEKKPYKGLLDAITRISNEEGFFALWNGAQASLILVSNPTIHFVVYDKVFAVMSKAALAEGRKRLTSWEIFVAGAIAKTIATIVTYPIQLAQTRLRALKSTGGKVKEGEEAYDNTIDLLLKVFKKEGVAGWFSGLNVKVVQTVLTAAFQFLCYEYIKDFIFFFLRPPKGASGGGGHGGA
jgi:adenine nucleotide transporter 17